MARVFRLCTSNIPCGSHAHHTRRFWFLCFLCFARALILCRYAILEATRCCPLLRGMDIWRCVVCRANASHVGFVVSCCVWVAARRGMVVVVVVVVTDGEDATDEVQGLPPFLGGGGVQDIQNKREHPRQQGVCARWFVHVIPGVELAFHPQYRALSSYVRTGLDTCRDCCIPWPC